MLVFAFAIKINFLYTLPIVIIQKFKLIKEDFSMSAGRSRFLLCLACHRFSCCWLQKTTKTTCLRPSKFDSHIWTNKRKKIAADYKRIKSLTYFFVNNNASSALKLDFSVVGSSKFEIELAVDDEPMRDVLDGATSVLLCRLMKSIVSPSVMGFDDCDFGVDEVGDFVVASDDSSYSNCG